MSVISKRTVFGVYGGEYAMKNESKSFKQLSVRFGH